MAMDFNDSKEKSIREIILGYLQKVSELNLQDLTNPRLGLIYISSVEGLADLLFPHFDERMNLVYKEYQENMQKAEADGFYNGFGKPIPGPITLAVRLSRLLFRELNLLLSRNDYLRESVYGEDASDAVVFDEEEE